MLTLEALIPTTKAAVNARDFTGRRVADAMVKIGDDGRDKKRNGDEYIEGF
jgi:hypothetical protein